METIRERVLLSRQEVAAMLGVSLATFVRHAQRAIASVRIGGRVLFDKEDVRRWIDAQKPVMQSSPQPVVSQVVRRSTLSPTARAILARHEQKKRTK